LRIAQHHRSHDIREEALGKVQDEQLLARVLMKRNLDRRLRLKTIRRLSDQKVLSRLALEIKQDEEASAAVDQISDEDELTVVASATHVSINRQIAIAHAVDRITDQQRLSAVVSSGSLAAPRALARIQDEGTLTEAVIASKRLTSLGSVAGETLSRIASERYLDQILHSDLDDSLRLPVLDRLNNTPATLRAIAEGDRSTGMRKAAVERITDEMVLKEIARANSEEVMVAAVRKICDEAFLEQTAEDHWFCHKWSVPPSQNNQSGGYGVDEGGDFERYPVREAATARLWVLRRTKGS
jgi:hypothetical protein